MTNQSNRTLARLAPLAAAAALLATACGSSTTTSQGDAPLPEAAVAADDAALDVHAPDSTDPVAAPATAPTVDTAPEPEPDPDPGPDPAPDLGLTVTSDPIPACGDFGPIPPTPDSMPTLMYDTDGDGNDDDEVTAYAGGGHGWVLRVVENGVVSEAQTPGIDGWAFISNDYQVDGRDYIEVTDSDEGTIFTLATVQGCVELLDTRNPIDDVVAPPAPPAPPECTLVEPIAPSATIVTDVTLDVTGDGIADDQIITYSDGGNWAIRSIVDGVSSEVGVADVGPGSVRALGAVDVGELSPGNEIIATTGAGASAVVIGVYGFDTNGCISAFSDKTGSPLGMTSGASIAAGSAFYCGTGYVAASVWQLDDDDTYSMYSYALLESTPGQFTYMPSSDAFDELMTVDELPSDIFDCDGLTL